MTTSVQLANGGKNTGIWRFSNQNPLLVQYVLPTDTMAGRLVPVTAGNADISGVTPNNIMATRAVREMSIGSFPQANGKNRDALNVTFVNLAARDSALPLIDAELVQFVRRAEISIAESLVNPARLLRQADFINHAERQRIIYGDGSREVIPAALVDVFNDVVAKPHSGEVVFKGVRDINNVPTVEIELHGKCATCPESSKSVEKGLMDMIDLYGQGTAKALKIVKPRVA